MEARNKQNVQDVENSEIENDQTADTRVIETSSFERSAAFKCRQGTKTPMKSSARVFE